MNLRRALLPALAAVLAGAAVLCAWLVLSPYRGYSGPEQFVVIERGMGLRAAADRLQGAGVVRSARVLSLYLAATGQHRSVHAGEYRFAGPLAVPAVAGKLARGEVFLHKVTVPEGLVFEEIRDLLASRGLAVAGELDRAFRRVDLVGDLDPLAQDLEGYLFPDTYLLPRGLPAEQILQRMVLRFRDYFDAERIRRAHALGLTLRQAVTLASLVEEEAAVDEERPLVSSVYHNRLRRGMRLECDPTVIYAARRAGRWDGVLHRSDLMLDSPYNTYRTPGLPPGPIANPGSASLEAALRPAETAFLYFVLQQDRRHVFSRDWSSHRRAVARYQRSQASGRAPAPR